MLEMERQVERASSRDVDGYEVKIGESRLELAKSKDEFTEKSKGSGEKKIDETVELGDDQSVKSGGALQKDTRATLPQLPTELLLDIIESLPPESKASLCLSSRRIYMRLGTEHLTALRATKHGSNLLLYKFLGFLERDVPHLVACSLCNKIELDHHHESSMAIVGGVANNSIEGSVLDRRDVRDNKTLNIMHRRYLFDDLQRHLHRYFQKGNTSASRDILSRNITEHMISKQCFKQTRYTFRISTKFRSIILRHQQIFRFSARRPQGHPSERRFRFGVCKHRDFVCEYYHSSRQFRIFPENPDGDLSSTDMKAGHPRSLYACDYCRTEFHLKELHLMSNHQPQRPAGDVLIITRWQDLGRMENAMDYDWKNASEAYYPHEPLVEQNYGLGEIFREFEGEGLSEDFVWDKDMTRSCWRHLLKVHPSLRIWGEVIRLGDGGNP